MKKICFIGGGNMAEAIIDFILKAGIFSKENILVSDVNRERLSYINLKFGIKTCLNDENEVRNSDIIVLSVKPQILNEVLEHMGSYFKENALFISILAGVKMQKIENFFAAKHKTVPLARIMPNLGAFIGKSVSAISFNPHISEEDKKIVEKIFKSIGYIHYCKEEEIDMVTAISGSGPAYVFYFMEAFIESAKNLGMNKEDSYNYCLETLDGACEMLKQNKADPAELRLKVSSKGGTTEAAINKFEEKQMKKIFTEALNAAFERAIELGKKC